MPRAARVVVEGGFSHILSRGNNRAPVFHDDADFLRYLQFLSDDFRKQHISLLHYCLMTNHVHLLVQIAQPEGLRRAMHGLNLRYALAYRKRYHHSGHLWQDRFKSLAIDKESYLLQCAAYVE